MENRQTLFPTADQDSEFLALYTDGASLGNPGSGGAGGVVIDPQGDVAHELSEPLGFSTNNEAEYKALILGLKKALAMGIKQLIIYMDSELVVKQIKGEYRVKNQGLKSLYRQAERLLQDLDTYDILHVRRKFNKQADKLASEAALEGKNRL